MPEYHMIICYTTVSYDVIPQYHMMKKFKKMLTLVPKCVELQALHMFYLILAEGWQWHWGWQYQAVWISAHIVCTFCVVIVFLVLKLSWLWNRFEMTGNRYS